MHSIKLADTFGPFIHNNIKSKDSINKYKTQQHCLKFSSKWVSLNNRTNTFGRPIDKRKQISEQITVSISAIALHGKEGRFIQSQLMFLAF